MFPKHIPQTTKKDKQRAMDGRNINKSSLFFVSEITVSQHVGRQSTAPGKLDSQLCGALRLELSWGVFPNRAESMLFHFEDDLTMQLVTRHMVHCCTGKS